MFLQAIALSSFLIKLLFPRRKSKCEIIFKKITLQTNLIVSFTQSLWVALEFGLDRLDSRKKSLQDVVHQKLSRRYECPYIRFLEFAGALRESKYVLYTYAVIMLVFCLVELVLALCLLFRQGVTRNALESFLDKQLQKYNESDEPLTEDIDGMQKYQQCCGVNGTEYWTQIGKQIPDSCLCKMETDYNCQKSSGVEYFHYQQGCVKAIPENHQRKDIYLGAATLVLTFLMFISMATAFGLAKKSKDKYINESFIKYKDNRAKKPMS